MEKRISVNLKGLKKSECAIGFEADGEEIKEMFIVGQEGMLRAAMCMLLNKLAEQSEVEFDELVDELKQSVKEVKQHIDDEFRQELKDLMRAAFGIEM